MRDGCGKVKKEESEAVTKGPLIVNKSGGESGSFSALHTHEEGK